MLKDIGNYLLKWKNVPLNLTGQINVFRMACLPKLLYSFSVVPMISLKHLSKMAHNEITEFIWSNTWRRINKSKLQLPIEKGGFNLPDLEKFNLAAQGFYI